MSDELDGYEKNYTELVEQISLECSAPPLVQKRSSGPTISLRDLVEGKELSFELDDDLCVTMPTEYEMSTEDQEQMEKRKIQLREGLQEMAKTLFGKASEHFESARKEHLEHVTRMSKKKRRTGADGEAAPGDAVPEGQPEAGGGAPAAEQPAPPSRVEPGAASSSRPSGADPALRARLSKVLPKKGGSFPTPASA